MNDLDELFRDTNGPAYQKKEKRFGHALGIRG